MAVAEGDGDLFGGLLVGWVGEYMVEGFGSENGRLWALGVKNM